MPLTQAQTIQKSGGQADKQTNTLPLLRMHAHDNNSHMHTYKYSTPLAIFSRAQNFT